MALITCFEIATLASLFLVPLMIIVVITILFNLLFIAKSGYLKS